MRCFDYFRKDERYKDAFNGQLGKNPIVDCTSVGKYYLEVSDKDEWSFDDFGPMFPPFDRCWLDFDAPEFIRFKTGIIEWKKNRPQKWGFDCTWTRATEENLERICKKTSSLWQEVMPEMKRFTAKSYWILDVYLFWVIEKNPEGPIWLWRIFLDESGNVVMENESVCTVEGPTNRGLIDLIDSLNMPKEESRKFLSENFTSFLHIACLGISFLNCKNVEIYEVKPARQKPLTNSQKRRGEKQYQEVIYKILNIIPKRKIHKRVGVSEEVEEKRQLRYHTVKGHFVTYTSEKPAFGKIVGTFFVHWHGRGNIEKGKVNKDYKITVKSDLLNENQ